MEYNGRDNRVLTQTTSGGFPGFAGVKHRGGDAAKQIQGKGDESKKSTRGADSSKESTKDLMRDSYATLFARPDQSFDGKEYQDTQKSMKGLPLTGAPIGSQDGNKFTKMPSNKSGSKSVGS